MLALARILGVALITALIPRVAPAGQLPVADRVITMDEIQRRLVNDSQMNVIDLVYRARPALFSANYRFVRTSPDSISGDSAYLAQLLGRNYACPLTTYTDDVPTGRPLTDLLALDIAEVRILMPHTRPVIGSKVMPVGDCPAIQIISLGKWYELTTDPVAAIDYLGGREAITVPLLDSILQRSGLIRRTGPQPSILVYSHPQYPKCGALVRPARVRWSEVPQATRDDARRLLNCLRSSGARIGSSAARS